MEDFDPILGPHQTELYYLLYNAFYLLGRDFSYGSFVPKTVVSGKYLFIVIIQYPCPKCPLKNIRGQTLTILKHSMKPKCKMYLKSSTCLISLSWNQRLGILPSRHSTCVFIMTFLCSKLIALACCYILHFYGPLDIDLS